MNTAKNSTEAYKFWSRVDVGPLEACWEWIGPISHRGGYATAVHHSKRLGAHRLSWILARGAIPQGMVVRHRCDNPKCCNPNHLELGTHKDNVQDMIQRGRRAPASAKGVRNCKAKLSEQDVRQIRTAYAQGGTSTIKLAKQYAVTQGLISQIVRHRIWRHIP
jgi:hypothetical protein